MIRPPNALPSHFLTKDPVLILITTLHFYVILFFQLVYSLSSFTRRPHWCHLPLNAEQLEVSGTEYILKHSGWVVGVWLDK